MDKKAYHININGTLVEVTEKVYLAYYRAKRRERYYEHNIKNAAPIRDANGYIIGYRPKKEVSLDALMEEGCEFVDEQTAFEDIVILRCMICALHTALERLPRGERELIAALFLSHDGDGMTEREYAAQIGVSGVAIHKRKAQILQKLKKFLDF